MDAGPHVQTRCGLGRVQSSAQQQKTYKPRRPIQLPPCSPAVFKSLVTATSVESVEADLQRFDIYDRRRQMYTDLRAAARSFDDWRRLVCVGPQAQAFWDCHSASSLALSGPSSHYHSHDLFRLLSRPSLMNFFEDFLSTFELSRPDTGPPGSL